MMIGERIAPMPGRPRIRIDGREIANVVAFSAERCLALVHESDTQGRPIADGNGGILTTRRAGRIEIIG